MATALDLGGPLNARIDQQGGGTLVTLTGYINEATDLSRLARLPGPLVINLARLDRINSIGVRRWMDFVKAVEGAGVALVFERVSPIMTGQIGMITNFMGTRSRVKSLDVPYRCTRCGAESVSTVELTATTQLPPSVPCPKCKSPSSIDDISETYDEALRTCRPRAA